MQLIKIAIVAFIIGCMGCTAAKNFFVPNKKKAPQFSDRFNSLQSMLELTGCEFEYNQNSTNEAQPDWSVTAIRCNEPSQSDRNAVEESLKNFVSLSDPALQDAKYTDKERHFLSEQSNLVKTYQRLAPANRRAGVYEFR